MNRSSDSPTVLSYVIGLEALSCRLVVIVVGREEVLDGDFNRSVFIMESVLAGWDEAPLLNTCCVKIVLRRVFMLRPKAVVFHGKKKKKCQRIDGVPRTLIWNQCSRDWS